MTILRNRRGATRSGFRAITIRRCRRTSAAWSRTKRLASRLKTTRRANHLRDLSTPPCQSQFEKIFWFSEIEIRAIFTQSHPNKGRIASRHERAVGCDGRDSVGRARDRRAGFPVSDRPARGRTALLTVFDETGRIVRGPARALARWARTVKSCGPGAPMLASSPAEMHPAQPGSRCIANPQGDGGKKAGHRGEYGVSRKPFARGKPE